MIGFVLVSHSARLAEGARELALQMAQGQVAIAAAGGLDDPDNPIGTDPMKVVQAINEVYHEDGVIVLMDLGSALMSAETALEFIDADWLPNIYLCDAPLVEGAVSAVVQASVGSPVEVVMMEARASLIGKQQHLARAMNQMPMPEAAEPAVVTHGVVETLRVIVPNLQGIHARPAARIVGIAGQYPAAQLSVQKDGLSVSANSINQVVLLNARKGDELCFQAAGGDAAAALAAVQRLVDDNFGDALERIGAEPGLRKPATAVPDGVLSGVAASKGMAVGKAFRLGDQLPLFDTHTHHSAVYEERRLQAAVADAASDVGTLIEQAGSRLGASEAAIFEAHRLLLKDETVFQPAIERLKNDGFSAEQAWWQTILALAERYRSAENTYLQARAHDVLDVGRRVLRKLVPNSAAVPEIREGSVLLANDLAPSDTAQLDPTKVRAILTQYGGATSHTAIIARGLGIPSVAGLGEQLDAITDGQLLVVDGDQGWVYSHPSADDVARFETQISERAGVQARLIAESRQPAVTPDKRRIEVAANVGKAQEAEPLAAMGADGIGLFRTELLFMDRSSVPSEDEQYVAYTMAAKALPGCPIIIRTLDVGGDKAIDSLHIEAEENPFLGYRGIRYWLGEPALARTQLRAICRASANHAIKMMYPMVGTLEEVEQAGALLAEVRAELKAEGIAFNPAMEAGIMIEVPSAVLIADQLAKHVDFFSIGTNDLTQYIMAADRGNAKVNALVNPFQPAVIRAIKQVVDAAHAEGKWVGMCGEMAGNPLATPLLLGLGLDELSMSAPSIPEVKAIIRRTSYLQAQEIARHVQTLHSAAEISAYLKTAAADV